MKISPIRGSGPRRRVAQETDVRRIRKSRNAKEAPENLIVLYRSFKASSQGVSRCCIVCGEDHAAAARRYQVHSRICVEGERRGRRWAHHRQHRQSHRQEGKVAVAVESQCRRSIFQDLHFNIIDISNAFDRNSGSPHLYGCFFFTERNVIENRVHERIEIRRYDSEK